ncbi:hypothetical protein HTZ84_04945 [Haloterrigena sp. SYSU A558-1]|uniref:Uncharacterized protein n=1 Tax=Haloterrigena gelatinilytica TaxID=2741724 RepID=A0ABX2L9U6_9EURY|nr:hypothetical protein [Haloterrigena gelatinilytica]NUC71663.1 hypothetical protein [Haloterrigena gelatinilytica]
MGKRKEESELLVNMAISQIRSQIGDFLENNSIITVAAFVVVILYTASILPLAYFLSTQTGLDFVDAVTIFSPVGTILVSVLLAVLYFGMLRLQSQQVEIMEEQAGWAEAANSPAIIIERWYPDGDEVVFYLRNEGNAHVEEMNLIADLEITDKITGETVEHYRSTAILGKKDSEGFESHFMPAQTSDYIEYKAGVMFYRNLLGGDESAGFRLSKIEALLGDLLEDRSTVLPCELTLKLESVAPGENVSEREFWRTSFGVFEEKNLEEVIDEGKKEDGLYHVQPEPESHEYQI